MKWITIEQMRGSGLSEHYAYCNDDYYILEENADENVLTILLQKMMFLMIRRQVGFGLAILFIYVETIKILLRMNW